MIYTLSDTPIEILYGSIKRRYAKVRLPDGRCYGTNINQLKATGGKQEIFEQLDK